MVSKAVFHGDYDAALKDVSVKDTPTDGIAAFRA
jgi:hypothetical protein